MNTQARDFCNLKTSMQENRLGEVSVSSVVDICKSYAQSEGTIDGNVEVINFFFTTRGIADRILLEQAQSIVQACLPYIRKFVSKNLNSCTKDNLIDILDKILIIIETLQNTVQFFARKFNWTNYHMTLKDFYINILSILTDIFVFFKKRCDSRDFINNNIRQLIEKLIKQVSELYIFILGKLSSPETAYFIDFSTSERDFLIEILKVLFFIGEITSSINPSIWTNTWKKTHKIISANKKELQKDVKGSVECLQAPIKFICQQLREKIRDIVQRNPANTQEILKITAFYLSIITNIIEFFPGDFLPHSFMILENLFYLQSVRFLVKSERAEEINKIITTPFMKNIGTLRKNTQFIECLLKANYSHDSERYAFLMISLEILKAMIDDKNLKDYEVTAEKSEVIQKIFSVIPKCNSIFLDHPEILEELSRLLSAIAITYNSNKQYRKICIDFLTETVTNPSTFNTFLMLQLYRNFQMVSREDIQFETFVLWKNIWERIPKISSSVQKTIIEEIIRIHFDSLPTESQHRVVNLNNPQEKYALWSALGLDRIPSTEKRNYLLGELSGKVQKLMMDFLGRHVTMRSFENMILILKILAKSKFSPGESFLKQYINMWRFIGNRNNRPKVLPWIFYPLMEMFMNFQSTLNPEDVKEIVKILRKIARNDEWPLDSHIEVIKSLSVIAGKCPESYWQILRHYRNSRGPLQLLSNQIQRTLGIPEPENLPQTSDSPPNKKFKEDSGIKNEEKLRKILKEVQKFKGDSLTPQCKFLVREIISTLRKTIDS